MSGDCKEQPLIFYSKVMTEAKIMLLEHHGIKFIKHDYYFNKLENHDSCGD